MSTGKDTPSSSKSEGQGLAQGQGQGQGQGQSPASGQSRLKYSSFPQGHNYINTDKPKGSSWPPR